MKFGEFAHELSVLIRYDAVIAGQFDHYRSKERVLKPWDHDKNLDFCVGGALVKGDYQKSVGGLKNAVVT